MNLSEPRANLGLRLLDISFSKGMAIGGELLAISPRGAKLAKELLTGK
jgi:hypothetical protein